MSGAKRMNKIILKNKKATKKSYKKYSEDLLELAVDAVGNNKISIWEAEKKFGIPRRTIYRRVRKRVTLPEEEEETIDGEIFEQLTRKILKLSLVDSEVPCLTDDDSWKVACPNKDRPENLSFQRQGDLSLSRRSQKTLEAEPRYECAPCKAYFQFNSQLKCHIRRHHFNRVGRVPHAETQEVDQVWYEKVANMDVVVKMRKVSENVLIIQKINDLTDLPTEVISEEQTEVLDVRDIYPISSRREKHFLECYVCHKSFGRRLLGKHFAKVHAHLVKKKCDACQMKFKRAFNCARHVCPESIQ